MKPNSTKPRELVRVAERNDFVLDRYSGSHAIYYRDRDKRRVVIPMHKRDVKTGLLRQLIFDMGLTIEQFNEQV